MFDANASQTAGRSRKAAVSWIGGVRKHMSEVRALGVEWWITGEPTYLMEILDNGYHLHLATAFRAHEGIHLLYLGKKPGPRGLAGNLLVY